MEVANKALTTILSCIFVMMMVRVAVGDSSGPAHAPSPAAQSPGPGISINDGIVNSLSHLFLYIYF